MIINRFNETNKNSYLSYINFKASPNNMPLIDALCKSREIDNSEIFDIFIKETSKNTELSSQKVVCLVGHGSTAAAYETPDGKILKLSIGNHFPMNRPHESFDVPLYAKGKIGKMHYYLEEKLYQHGLSKEFVEDVKQAIKQKGYKTFDFYDYDIQQIGISKDGKLYLLDPECAKYKTVFHAIFDKIKNRIRKLK